MDGIVQFFKEKSVYLASLKDAMNMERIWMGGTDRWRDPLSIFVYIFNTF